jgi:ribonuclease HII
MDPLDRSVEEIAAYMERGHASDAFLRILAMDPRRSVQRLAARHAARRAAARSEACRVRALYREERLRARAGLLVAGVDEVGRGPLAGPVLAAAVILPACSPIPGLDDSKRLAPARRERLAQEIRVQAVAVTIGEASVEEIDRLNILRASHLAMCRAVAALTPPPGFLLVDGHARLPGPWPQAPIVGGDGRCACIAAASIVAKVARDRLMRCLHEAFPQYGFARHHGYATAEHLAALRRHGPSPAHRRTFLPVRQLTLVTGS